jgi:hypothetical protein
VHIVLWCGELAQGYVPVANAAQGREVVDQQKERGADFSKVYTALSREAYFAIADEAHKRDITFVGHVPDSVKASEVSDAGQKSIEHLEGVALARLFRFRRRAFRLSWQTEQR